MKIFVILVWRRLLREIYQVMLLVVSPVVNRRTMYVFRREFSLIDGLVLENSCSMLSSLTCKQTSLFNGSWIPY